MPLPSIVTDPENRKSADTWKTEADRTRTVGGLAYWRAVRGSRTKAGGDTRVLLALGNMLDADAGACLAALNWLRDHGTATGALPTPDRLVLHMRDQTRDRSQAREDVVALLLKVGRTLADATGGGLDAAALRGLLPELFQGEAPAPVDYSALTLKEYFDTTFANERAGAVVSWKNERAEWEKRILPVMGALRLRDLDPSRDDPRDPGRKPAHVHFDAFLREHAVKADGTPLSGASKRLLKAAYKALLDSAARQGHIGAVHAFYVIKGSTKRATPPAAPLTEGQVEALLNAATTPMHRALFATAVALGLRPSEVRALRWEHVALAEETVFIHGTKTEASKATIPLFALALRELRTYWLACGRPAEGHVFTWRGKPLASVSGYKHSLETAAKKAGIGAVNPYLLRHTFASRSRESGATLADVAAIMRHTSPRMLEKTYDHSATVKTVDAASFPEWKAKA